MSQKLKELRELCEADLYNFAVTMFPTRYWGDLHKEMFAFWTREDASKDQLTLVPRDHQKSVCIAIWAAWYITKNPWTTIAYVTGVSDLAQRQTRFIKRILESDIYRMLWPEMLNWVKDDEGRMKHVPLYKWNENEFEVYHPDRRARGINDPTMKATSVGSTNTGFHFNVLLFDDLVTEKNFDTEAGREEVKGTYAAFSSIATNNSIVKAVGTRYHPKDQYQLMMDEEREVYDDEGNFLRTEKNYEVFIRKVEEDGVFCWPRKLVPELGEHFGFDWNELARKKSKYKASGRMEQYYAQYYNQPNDPELHKLDRNKFQYYDEKHLKWHNGKWHFNNYPLNVFAAMDVAYTDGKQSDYTAIVVIGLDEDGDIYVLDLDRFKTNKFNVYYERMVGLQTKWNFRKIQVETNAGGVLVAQYLRDEIKKNGASVAVEGKHKTANEGKKSERIAAIIEPRYENMSIWHPKCGIIGLLEEEIILPNPPHDDLKDALAAAISISRPPAKQHSHSNISYIRTHHRFGGMRR